MITNAKRLNISKSQAQKTLDEVMNEIVNKKAITKLLPTDWTLERLMEKGISKNMAYDVMAEAVKKGLAVEIRYKRDNGYIAKGCRAVKESHK